MNQNTPLRVENLCFVYGANPILRGVGLEVNQGEMLGVVGPNGAGKTTFLNIISGTLKPRDGEVYLGGVALREFQPKDRARTVAMVPQNSAVPLGFTVQEIVLMGRNPHLGLLQWEGKKDLDVCHRVMEQTNTSIFAHRLISTLSSGERHRVFIARALAQEAHLLLLDEPTAHLDIGYQTEVMDLIAGIRKEAKITVVAAMHDLTLAAQYCDRLAVLNKGIISALGQPDEVLTPEVISQAFGAEVSIIKHPTHQTPVVLPVGKRIPRATP